MGEGTVQIRMYDGVIRTLKGVHYVPGLRKSMISLGQLASKGCEVAIHKDSLRVSKGAFVVMKGDMFHNLYLLRGSTVLGKSRLKSTVLVEKMSKPGIREGTLGFCIGRI